MANKGGKKAKEMAQQQALQRAQAGRNPDALAKEKEKELKAKAKEAELRRKKEEAALFQTAITQPKVPFGVDPKTIMCAFFKAGICEKGKQKDASHHPARLPLCRDCKYRHALPPGFVLKSEKKAAEEAAKKEVISLEDFLETERHKLKPPLTPVTPETFAVWKKTRMDKRKAEEEAKEKAKIAQRAAGKLTGMSGKDMFAYGTDFLGEEEEEEDDWDLNQYLANRDPSARQDNEAVEENDLRGSSDVDDDDDGGADEDDQDVNGVTEQLEETSVAA
ncbi:hypothetical protein QFC19_001433 [Naganishia cerealis]|uniref:Uncharacterized protein n=1 Tax=Naganishia cerealis TaxID=610337 RepID=A0ACC2WIB2_9TREE|nr:hypothetical protein QFC19_001433 [Naganishia cerealis]